MFYAYGHGITYRGGGPYSFIISSVSPLIRSSLNAARDRAGRAQYSVRGPAIPLFGNKRNRFRGDIFTIRLPRKRTVRGGGL